jgi:hypothetical protein
MTAVPAQLGFTPPSSEMSGVSELLNATVVVPAADVQPPTVTVTL